jgi:hypothetical protein
MSGGDRPASAVMLAIYFGTLLILIGVGPAIVALPAWGWLLVVASVTAVSSWWASPGTSLLSAAIGWLMLNGFVVNGLGELSWHGPADLGRLLFLAAVAMAVRAVRGPLSGHRHIGAA